MDVEPSVSIVSVSVADVIVELKNKIVYDKICAESRDGRRATQPESL